MVVPSGSGAELSVHRTLKGGKALFFFRAAIVSFHRFDSMVGLLFIRPLDQRPWVAVKMFVNKPRNGSTVLDPGRALDLPGTGLATRVASPWSWPSVIE